MPINWYPGHMKKTHDLIREHLKLVDVAVEVRDARLPLGSRNPQFDELLQGKRRVVVLNKCDLADADMTRLWIREHESRGVRAVAINALNGTGIPELMEAIRGAAQDVYEKMKRQGRRNRPIRLMIVGIPNVGKSALINRLSGKNAAKTGNKPGVTRGKQWIRLNKELELFDTPGILWPKIEDDVTGMKLAASGAIKDEVVDSEEIAYHLVAYMRERYPSAFYARFGLEPDAIHQSPVEIMEAIGRRRGCLMKGDAVDLEKASRLIIDDFRRGALGRISLEWCSDEDVGETGVSTPETGGSHVL